MLNEVKNFYERNLVHFERVPNVKTEIAVVAAADTDIYGQVPGEFERRRNTQILQRCHNRIVYIRPDTAVSVDCIEFPHFFQIFFPLKVQ